MFMNFSQKKMLKQFWIIFNRVNENYDGSRRERYSGTQKKLVQQRMSAMLTTLFLAKKELSYTK